MGIKASLLGKATKTPVVLDNTNLLFIFLAIKSIHIKTIIKHSIIIIILYFFIVLLFKVIYYFKFKLSIYKSINGFNFNIDLESIKNPADNL